MSRTDGPVRTEDLVRTLEALGFTALSVNGSHTLFRHAGGALVTVPTGRDDVPDVFLKAVIGQTTARNLASGDEVRRLLRAEPAPPHTASRKAGMPA